MTACRAALQSLRALLDYPSEELQAALPEIRAALAAEGLISAAARQELTPLFALIAASDVLDCQEQYCDLFDRSRAVSLNLFEHVHGEARDRGQAMVDLKQKYADAGFELVGGELPDYLPVLLEYLSQRPAAEAREMLADCAHILASVKAALIRRQSPYAGAFTCLLELAGEPAGEQEQAPASDIAVADDTTPEALDRAWAEAPVTFGGGCAPAQAAVQPAVMRFYRGAAS